MSTKFTVFPTSMIRSVDLVLKTVPELALFSVRHKLLQVCEQLFDGHQRELLCLFIFGLLKHFCKN